MDAARSSRSGRRRWNDRPFPVLALDVNKVVAANSSVLRAHVRCGSTPAADIDAKVGRGLLILTSATTEPAAPAAPAGNRADVALLLEPSKRHHR